jgi:hypothetical protein
VYCGTGLAFFIGKGKGELGDYVDLFYVYIYFESQAKRGKINEKASGKRNKQRWQSTTTMIRSGDVERASGQAGVWDRVGKEWTGGGKLTVHNVHRICEATRTSIQKVPEHVFVILSHEGCFILPTSSR